MSIHKVAYKIKGYLENTEIFSFLVVILAAAALTGSFFLYEVGQGGGVVVFDDNSLSKGGLVLGSSKNRAYFYPWCRQGQTVKAQDRVEFYSIAQAQAAGYKASKQCAGLK